MVRTTIPAKTVVLVCDGGKALFFRNDGDAQALNLVVIDQLEQKVPRAHELGTDRPGRTQDSHDGSRSAMAATDRHRQSEAAFLRLIGERLDELVTANRVKHLIIAAPPAALGLLLPELSRNVKAVLEATVPHDLVKLPTTMLEQRLAKLSELPVE